MGCRCHLCFIPLVLVLLGWVLSCNQPKCQTAALLVKRLPQPIGFASPTWRHPLAMAPCSPQHATYYACHIVMGRRCAALGRLNDVV